VILNKAQDMAAMFMPPTYLKSPWEEVFVYNLQKNKEFFEETPVE